MITKEIEVILLQEEVPIPDDMDDEEEYYQWLDCAERLYPEYILLSGLLK